MHHGRGGPDRLLARVHDRIRGRVRARAARVPAIARHPRDDARA